MNKYIDDEIVKLVPICDFENHQYNGMYVFFKSAEPLYVDDAKINDDIVDHYLGELLTQNNLTQVEEAYNQLNSNDKLEFVSINNKDRIELYSNKYAESMFEYKEIMKPRTRRGVAWTLTGLTIAVGLLVGGCKLVKGNKHETKNPTSITNEEYDTKSFASIMEHADKNSARYKLFESMMKYSKTSMANAEAILAEAMTYGDYSEEQIIKIFGESNYNFNEEAYKDNSLKSLNYLVNYGKVNGDRSLLIGDAEAMKKYTNYERMYRKLLINYGSKETFKSVVTEFDKQVRTDLGLEAVAESKTNFDYKETTNSDDLIASRDFIAASLAVAAAGQNKSTLTDKEIGFINESDMCEIAREKAADINETLKFYRISNINNNEDNNELSFEEWFEAFSKYVAENNKDMSKLNVVDENYAKKQEEKRQELANSINKDSSTTIKNETKTESGSWDGKSQIPGFTADEYKSAEEQKEAIDAALKAESEKNYQEAMKDAQDKIDEIEREEEASKDAAQDEADDYNENIENGNGTVGRPGSGADIIIDEDAPEFDGPIYDQNGNIIAQSSVAERVEAEIRAMVSAEDEDTISRVK